MNRSTGFGLVVITLVVAAAAAGHRYMLAPESPPAVFVRDVDDTAPCSMLTVDRKGDKFERVTVDFVCIVETYPDVPVYVRQPDPVPPADDAPAPQP